MHKLVVSSSVLMGRAHGQAPPPFGSNFSLQYNRIHTFMIKNSLEPFSHIDILKSGNLLGAYSPDPI